jgi:DeoR family transcriptional regulator of aga operon
LVVASELWARGNILLQLLGGQVRARNPDLAGPMTEVMLDRLTADIAFLGSDGLDPTRGSFASDAETARIAERMAECARRVVVVCDSSKLGRAGSTRYLKTEEIDLLITDTNADPSLVKQMASRNVQVKQA